MMQHPAIMALLITSLIICAMMLYASWYGRQILGKWDLSSGSELQLTLERRTYLISTILSYALLFQILSLFLYIFTADDLHILFTGAMCAAGTLNVNSYGYPTLILKLVNCILAGVWLIINYADTRGYDYPLIKAKYILLGILALLVLLETLLMFRYFGQLKGDVITSCCGSLFSSDKPSIAGDIAGLPHSIMQPVFFAAMGATLVCGLVFLWNGRGGYLFPLISSLTFVIAAASLRTAYPSLPLLHPPEGIRLRRVCPVCHSAGRCGDRNRCGRADAVQTLRQPGPGRTVSPAQTRHGHSAAVSAVHAAGFLPNALH